MTSVQDFEKAFQQRLINSALLLTLWHRASSEETNAGGRLRLMKLAYLLSRQFHESGICALNVQFYRWHFGPMSNEVHEAWERLTAANLMEEEEVWSLTETGTSLAQGFYEDVLREETNAPVRRALDAVAKRWCNVWSAQPLMLHIYELHPCPDGTGPLITNMQLGEEFPEPVEPEHAKATLEVSNAWIETLAFEMNPANMARLRAAVEDFRAGRYIVA